MMDKKFSPRPTLTGREIKEGDFYLDNCGSTAGWMDHIDFEGSAGWTYQLTAAVPVDDIFGTNVETEDNADYLCFYISVSPGYYNMYRYMDVVLCKEKGCEEYYVRPLSEAECKVLLRMVRRFEIARLQRALDEQ